MLNIDNNIYTQKNRFFIRTSIFILICLFCLFLTSNIHYAFAASIDQNLSLHEDEDDDQYSYYSIKLDEHRKELSIAFRVYINSLEWKESYVPPKQHILNIQHIKELRGDLKKNIVSLIKNSTDSESIIAINKAKVESTLGSLNTYESFLGKPGGVLTNELNILSRNELDMLLNDTKNYLVSLEKSIAKYNNAEIPTQLLMRKKEIMGWHDAFKTEIKSRKGNKIQLIKIDKNLSSKYIDTIKPYIDKVDGPGKIRYFTNKLKLQIEIRLSRSPNDAGLMSLKNNFSKSNSYKIIPKRGPPSSWGEPVKDVVGQIREAAYAEQNGIIVRDRIGAVKAKAQMDVYGQWLKIAYGIKGEKTLNSFIFMESDDLIKLKKGYNQWLIALEKEKTIKIGDPQIDIEIKEAHQKIAKIDMELKQRHLYPQKRTSYLLFSRSNNPGSGPNNPGSGPNNPGSGPNNSGSGPNNSGSGPNNSGFGKEKSNLRKTEITRKSPTINQSSSIETSIKQNYKDISVHSDNQSIKMNPFRKTIKPRPPPDVGISYFDYVLKRGPPLNELKIFESKMEYYIGKIEAIELRKLIDRPSPILNHTLKKVYNDNIAKLKLIENDILIHGRGTDGQYAIDSIVKSQQAITSKINKSTINSSKANIIIAENAIRDMKYGSRLSFFSQPNSIQENKTEIYSDKVRLTNNSKLRKTIQRPINFQKLFPIDEKWTKSYKGLIKDIRKAPGGIIIDVALGTTFLKSIEKVYFDIFENTISMLVDDKWKTVYPHLDLTTIRQAWALVRDDQRVATIDLRPLSAEEKQWLIEPLFFKNKIELIHILKNQQILENLIGVNLHPALIDTQIGEELIIADQVIFDLLPARHVRIEGENKYKGIDIKKLREAYLKDFYNHIKAPPSNQRAMYKSIISVREVIIEVNENINIETNLDFAIYLIPNFKSNSNYRKLKNSSQWFEDNKKILKENIPSLKKLSIFSSYIALFRSIISQKIQNNLNDLIYIPAEYHETPQYLYSKSNIEILTQLLGDQHFE